MIEGRLMTCACVTVSREHLREISRMLHDLDLYMHKHQELKPLTITYPKEGIDPKLAFDDK